MVQAALIAAISILILSHSFSSGVQATTFTIVNKCGYVVWPGILSNARVPAIPTTGFALQSGETKTIAAPTSWSGRFWGRTHCSQDSTGKFSCLTGDCGSGKLECAGSGPIPPVTFSEFTLDGEGGLDFFDVSLVDGYNIPMLVVPQGGTGQNCTNTGCVVDLNASCASELKVTSSDGQDVFACKSACQAFGQSQYCCSGDYGTPDTCNPSYYSQVVKIACPRAYSYAYDDKTSTFICANANYTITFCPSPNTSYAQFLYESCRDTKFKCGPISVGYPFFGGDRGPQCGHPNLYLECGSGSNSTSIQIDGVKYEVLQVNSGGRTLRIARQDFINDGFCSPQSQYRSFDSDLFEIVNASGGGGGGYPNLTLFYDCQQWKGSSILGPFPCSKNTSKYKNAFVMIGNIPPLGCSAINVTVPILQTSLEGINNSSSFLKDALEKGFEVRLKEDVEQQEACQKCNNSGGICGFNFFNETTCYCPSPVPNDIWKKVEICPRRPPSPANAINDKGKTSKSKLKTYIIIGLTVGIVTTVIIGVSIVRFIVPWFKGRKPSSKNNARIEELIANYGSLAPKRYSYSDIKKITNKFKDKLGKGGYGIVYKGKLFNGRLVAVKVLSESKGNGEEFVNEIASIGRTSHVNIVSLLGFCYDKSKRALLYEFMPNGSLDNFIYNKGGSLDQSHRLEWKTLYDIALGIARGLEYLHQGCNTRILHFDIKPHNILLDENFCPKISDFGLSKLCERKESIISMTGARGTCGYIAPEVVFRSLGGVSHKSDVYSYGMMVLEMVGGRKNINIGVSKTSEVYFPTWIHKHLDEAMNLNDIHGVSADEEEEEMMKKLIVVSLWCIQTNPSDRPSITKALEMLQGSLQSLEIPPRPFAYSPVRSP